MLLNSYVSRHSYTSQKVPKLTLVLIRYVSCLDKVSNNNDVKVMKNEL
jgi:hypothetical protein